MINRKFLTVGASFATALLAVACNGDKLTSLNKNPNSPEDVPASSLFTTGAVRAVNQFLGDNYDLRGTEFVAQHLSEVQYPDEDRYVRLTGGSTTTYFDDPYRQELEDFEKVIEKGLASKEAGIYGPAMVMKTWEFGYITNTWGDVPYFNALKGDVTGTDVLSPAYDPQKNIYADFFVVLDKASKDMSTGTGSLGGGDPIYGGDPLQWQRFANSLRARYALQLVNVEPATTSTQLTAALAAPGGLFKSNADNTVLNWPGDGVYNNPWASDFSTRDDHRVSVVLLNLMKANSDPRVPIYAQPTPDDPTVYRGAPNALSTDAAGVFLATASRAGVVFYPGNTVYGFYGGGGNSFPSHIMTYAEVEFILAEAAERGIGGVTGAAVHYNAGIRASMEQWGVSAANIAAYLAQASTVYKGGQAGLIQIGQQKWIALYTDGGQAWAEWRRTCVPFTIQPGPAATQATVPRRFEYSITELSVNAAHVAEAVTRQGPDDFNSRMYWDKTPAAAPTYSAIGANCGVRGAAPSPGPP